MDELCYKVLKSIKIKGNVVNIGSESNRKYCSVINALKELFAQRLIIFDEDDKIVLTEKGLEYLIKNTEKKKELILEREEQKLSTVDDSRMYLPKK